MLVPHKFVGWLVMLLVIVSQVVLGRLGYEHNLYQYAGGPDVPLSDMNGQGHFAADRAWFRAYWVAVAVILVALTNALWRRGDAGSRACGSARCRAAWPDAPDGSRRLAR